MIKVNRIYEDGSVLMYGDEIVGIITSHLELNDVRLQIKQSGADGYYIIWNNIQINIDKYGRLDHWPVGFYDIMDEQLYKLIDWGDN